MLGARNARREARGEAPLDVDDEIARLTAPARDPALVCGPRSARSSRPRTRAGCARARRRSTSRPRSSASFASSDARDR